MLKQRVLSTSLVTLFVLVFLAGCNPTSFAVLDPAGPVAQIQLDLIYLSLGIMIIVLAAVFLIFGYTIWKYREKPGDDHIPEQVEGSKLLETIWITIPVIFVIILSVPTVIKTFELAETFPGAEAAEEQLAESTDLRVNVTARQYWWEFEYPDHGINTAQDLYIPVGSRVYFELTSTDVIHSFWVPRLGGKVDTNPGLINTLYLQADEPGVFFGKCTELCGESHALMDFKVIAVEPDEFEEWLDKMANFNEEEKPQSVLASEGRDLFASSCIACHALEADQFYGAPNLAGFGDRLTVGGYLDNDLENVMAWIRNPDDLKAGVTSQMPPASAFGLDDDDIEAIATYLLDLTLD